MVKFQIFEEVKHRYPYYRKSWKDAARYAKILIAPTIYVFLNSLIPGTFHTYGPTLSTNAASYNQNPTNTLSNPTTTSNWPLSMVCPLIHSLIAYLPTVISIGLSSANT